jgi:hypothetical protein
MAYHKRGAKPQQARPLMSDRYDELAAEWMEMAALLRRVETLNWTPIGIETGRQHLAAHFRQANSSPQLVEALREITKGKGAYSTDPLRHAANCIEDMKQLARTALAAQAALAARDESVPHTLLDPREWLIHGGNGHEDGEDGIRAMTINGNGLVEFLEAYRDDCEEKQ